MNEHASIRPDPAVDLVGSLRWIMDHISALETERVAKRITAAEAARRLGYDDRYFHGRPWRVPGFGLNGAMHSLEAWTAWVERPEVERRAEWDAMSVPARKRARGLAS